MTNCKKVPINSRTHRLHVSGRETLAMSVIVEEPASMRDSRLEEQEQHPDDIKPNGCFLEEVEERPGRFIARGNSNALAPPASDSLVYRSESKSKSASSSASTTPSSLEHHNSRTLQSQSRSPRAEPPQNQLSKSRSRHRKSLTRYAQDPRSIPLDYERSSHSDPEYTPRFKSSNSSSPEEEEERYDHHHGRPHRRNRTSQSSGTRLKASSIPQSKASTTSRGERRQSPNSLYSSPDERPRSKSSTKLDSIHLPFSNDMYEYHQRAESRQALTPPTSSRERCRSKSLKEVHGKRQMPPFRRPSRLAGDDRPSSKLSSKQAYASAEERMHHQMPSRHLVATNSGRAKSSLPLNSLVTFTETESYEDRSRPFEVASPPPRQRSTSSPKPMSRTYAGGQRQVASCWESKTPVTLDPKLLSLAKPAKAKLQPSSHPFLSPRDPTRTRLTSLLPKQSPTPASSGGLTPHPASASRLPSLASAPPRRMSVPEFPLRLRHYEGRFSNRRRQTLFYFSLFPPEKMPMRGVVLYLHGIGDHCRRNVSLYERLCREGFGVITYDLLNHGVSDLDQHKTRAHISDFNHLVEDTNDFITFAKRSIYMDALRYWRKHHRRYHPHGQESNPDTALLPELPLVIAGTSFGSLIGIYTILSGQHKFHAAVWGSPTVGVTWNPLLWAESKLAKSLATVIPKAKLVPAVQHDLLSRDPKFLRKFKADPLTSMDMMTTRTGHESLQAMIQLQEDTRITDPNSAFCAVPTLFLAGSTDGISNQQAAIKFFATMGNFDKEFKLFAGLFHLVYEEPEKEDVFRYLAKWLHRRFPNASRQ